MSDLAAFLLARIEDEEALAQRAGGDGWWGGSQPSRAVPSAAAVVSASAEVAACLDLGVAQHIAHWSPARALAECAANRRIVELHRWGVLSADGLPEVQVCGTCGVTGVAPALWPCPTLWALAQVHVDHPDFDPAWRVEW